MDDDGIDFDNLHRIGIEVYYREYCNLWWIISVFVDEIWPGEK